MINDSRPPDPLRYRTPFDFPPSRFISDPVSVSPIQLAFRTLTTSGPEIAAHSLFSRSNVRRISGDNFIFPSHGKIILTADAVANRSFFLGTKIDNCMAPRLERLDILPSVSTDKGAHPGPITSKTKSDSGVDKAIRHRLPLRLQSTSDRSTGDPPINTGDSVRMTEIQFTLSITSSTPSALIAITLKNVKSNRINAVFLNIVDSSKDRNKKSGQTKKRDSSEFILPVIGHDAVGQHAHGRDFQRADQTSLKSVVVALAAKKR